LVGDKGLLELSALKDTRVEESLPKTEFAGNTPRQMRSEDMMRRGMTSSWDTVDSTRTKVEENDDEGEDEMMMDEFGLVYFGKKVYDGFDSSGSSRARYTLVGDDDSEIRRDSALGATGQTLDNHDFDTMFPSGVSQASGQLPSSQQETETSSLFSTLEFPKTEDNLQAMGRPMNSMAGIGTRNNRQMSSESFSVAAMSHLSSHGFISPPTQQTHSFESGSPRTDLDTLENNVAK
jgi:hypothetical protein